MDHVIIEPSEGSPEECVGWGETMISYSANAASTLASALKTTYALMVLLSVPSRLRLGWSSQSMVMAEGGDLLRHSSSSVGLVLQESL